MYGRGVRSLAPGVMSQKNREGQRTAREKLREQQEREKATAKRNKGLKIGAVIVVVLVVAAGVGVLVSQQSGDDAKAKAAPISVGKASAPSKLTVYEDFRCPACGQFENQFRSTIGSLEQQGKLKVDYNIVTIIDGNMGGSGSKNAANAAMCADDEGKFKKLHDTLYQNQPPETNDAFANKKTILKLAKKAGIGSASFTSCVNDGKHNSKVQASNEAFSTSGHSATPTVLLNGKNVYGQSSQLTPAQLKQKVEAAA